MKLTTTIANISSIPNSTNQALLHQFYQYMKSIGTSESYQNGNLKIMIYLAKFLGSHSNLYEIQREQIIDSMTGQIFLPYDRAD